MSTAPRCLKVSKLDDPSDIFYIRDIIYYYKLLVGSSYRIYYLAFNYTHVGNMSASMLPTYVGSN
jgi:hypothetical protein